MGTSSLRTVSLRTVNRPATGGSLLVSGELAPGRSITYPVVITWHFPNITEASATGGVLSQVQQAWHPYYATRWKDAARSCSMCGNITPACVNETQAFHDALFRSTLPAYVLDAVSANLGILKSPTVLRQTNGDLWGWEGCFCDSGCCPGSLHPRLELRPVHPASLPALERTLRERELEKLDGRARACQLPSSPHRAYPAQTFHPASDGQLGGIMKVLPRVADFRRS